MFHHRLLIFSCGFKFYQHMFILQRPFCVTLSSISHTVFLWNSNKHHVQMWGSLKKNTFSKILGKAKENVVLLFLRAFKSKVLSSHIQKEDSSVQFFLNLLDKWTLYLHSILQDHMFWGACWRRCSPSWKLAHTSHFQNVLPQVRWGFVSDLKGTVWCTHLSSPLRRQHFCFYLF